MYIKQITLKNIKSFKDVTFDFTRPDGSFAGWTVFVGGNGSGKTTVLRAIALALTESGFLSRINGWISTGESRATALATICWDSGTDHFRALNDVSADFPTGDFEAGVKWVDDGIEGDLFESGTTFGRLETSSFPYAPKQGPWRGGNQGWFLAGYGPMRRLSGSSDDANFIQKLEVHADRIITLFVEGAALSDGEEWLRRVHARSLESDRADLEEIKCLLSGTKALLNDGLLPDGYKISRVTVDRVYIKNGRGVELPLDDVSDGCRSVLATALDLVRGLYESYGDLFAIESTDNDSAWINLPGVVLIDEAEAHLHPAWQRDLPEWFKRHFPNIQFIVTTHSPLIAQAADDNGLFILPGQGDVDSAPRRATAEELERIRLRTAYDALLETAFGLDTTRTPATINLMERWQWLDAKRRAGKLGETEVDEYSELRGKMQIAFPAKSELADV